VVCPAHQDPGRGAFLRLSGGNGEVDPGTTHRTHRSAEPQLMPAPKCVPPQPRASAGANKDAAQGFRLELGIRQARSRRAFRQIDHGLARSCHSALLDAADLTDPAFLYSKFRGQCGVREGGQREIGTEAKDLSEASTWLLDGGHQERSRRPTKAAWASPWMVPSAKQTMAVRVKTSTIQARAAGPPSGFMGTWHKALSPFIPRVSIRQGRDAGVSTGPDLIRRWTAESPGGGAPARTRPPGQWTSRPVLAAQGE